MKKATKVENAAQEAWDAGWNILVLRVWDEVFSFQGTGNVIHATDALHRAEAIGWQLADTAYSWVEKKNRGVFVMTLRRPQESVRQESVASAAPPMPDGPLHG